MQKATRKMIKSKRRMLRNERISSVVEATLLGLKTKLGLRPNSSISAAYIQGSYLARIQSVNNT
jgi:hypothetical protein